MQNNDKPLIVPVSVIDSALDFMRPPKERPYGLMQQADATEMIFLCSDTNRAFRLIEVTDNDNYEVD